MARTGRVTRRGIGRARLGMTKPQALRAFGTPLGQGARSLRFCVSGGGVLSLAFDGKGRARLVKSTSFSSRLHRLRPGSSLRAFKRAYPHAIAIGRRLVRTTRRSRVVFGACTCGSADFIAVTNVRRAAKIRYYAKRV